MSTEIPVIVPGMVKCSWCKRVYRVDLSFYRADRWDIDRRFFLRLDLGEKKILVRPYTQNILCPSKEGHYVDGYWKAIKGYTVKDVLCSSKCLNAVGPSCECQCGGKNHGVNRMF